MGNALEARVIYERLDFEGELGLKSNAQCKGTFLCTLPPKTFSSHYNNSKQLNTNVLVADLSRNLRANDFMMRLIATKATGDCALKLIVVLHHLTISGLLFCDLSMGAKTSFTNINVNRRALSATRLECNYLGLLPY